MNLPEPIERLVEELRHLPALRALRTDAGQVPQFLDEPFDRFRQGHGNATA